MERVEQTGVCVVCVVSVVCVVCVCGFFNRKRERRCVCVCVCGVCVRVCGFFNRKRERRCVCVCVCVCVCGVFAKGLLHINCSEQHYSTQTEQIAHSVVWWSYV